MEERDDAGGIHNDLPQHFHGSAAKLGQGKLQRRPEVEDRIRALFRGRLGCRLANQEGPVVQHRGNQRRKDTITSGELSEKPSRWPPGQSRQGRARPSGRRKHGGSSSPQHLQGLCGPAARPGFHVFQALGE